MITKFDFFGQKDSPAIILCNPDFTRVGSLGRVIYDTSLTLRFNAMSTFSFKVPQSIDGGKTTLDIYSKVKNKKRVFIEDVGYFIIDSAVESNDGSVPYITVECNSLEAEMLSKKVNSLSGTFRLFNATAPVGIPVTFVQGSAVITSSTSHNLVLGQAIRFSNINVGNFTSGKDYYVVAENDTNKTFSVGTSPSAIPIVAGIVTANGTLTPSPLDSLIGYILSLLNMNVTNGVSALGGWTLGGTLDGSLAAKYRTFDVSDSTIYNFLMTDVETAYECIFTFDTVNKQIHIDTLTGAVVTTDVFISYDNLVQQTELSEMADEIATALHVYGGDALDIRSVNPTGSNIIYDFTYYKTTEWMTQGLIDAINAWEAKIASNQTVYTGYLTNLLTYNNELSVLDTELAVLQAEYSALEVGLKAAIESGTGVGAAKSALDAKGVLVTQKQLLVISKEQEIANVTSSIVSINTDLNINNSINFTEAQRIELSRYVFENTYQNENIIILDSYTPAQIQTTKQELYNQGLNVLTRVSRPRYEFSVDAVNFIALKEFSTFTSQIPITLGASVMIGTSNYPIQSVLLEMEYSFDNPEDFSMTFSNRLRLDNGKFQYSDLAGQVVKTGSSVSFDKPSWGNWANSYKDDVTNFITSSLNATNNEIINSTNQEIVINAAGLRGKKSTGVGTYEPNQVWLTSNTLAFTDDNWATAKTAVGRINLGGGAYGYGISGSYILGNIIAGNDLTISNSNNNFILNETGATLTNAKLTIQSQYGGAGGIILDPNDLAGDVVKIGSITGGIIVSPTFYVNNAGNVTMTGNLYAGSNYIKTDGTAKIGGLVINGTDATFTGAIHATTLTGNLDWSNLTNVPANKVDSGYPAGYIGAGTITGSSGIYGSSGYFSITGNSATLTGYDWLQLGQGGTNKISMSGGNVFSMTSGGSMSFISNTLKWNGNDIATQSWVTNQGYATQAWVTSRGYLTSIPTNPTFGVITINDINLGTSGYGGLGAWNSPVSMTFRDNSNVLRTITVRAGIVTYLS